MHCELCIKHCALSIMNYALSIMNCALCIKNCALCIKNCALCIKNCALKKHYLNTISLITGLPTSSLSWAMIAVRVSIRSLRSAAEVIFMVITPFST